MLTIAPPCDKILSRMGKNVSPLAAFLQAENLPKVMKPMFCPAEYRLYLYKEDIGEYSFL